MTIGDQYEMLGREGGQFANALFGARDQRRADRAANVRAERERFEAGAPGWEGWDEAARQSAVRDALLTELGRLDPTNPLLNVALRDRIAGKGEAAYIRGGRKELTDANVLSNGEVRIR